MKLSRVMRRKKSLRKRAGDFIEGLREHDGRRATRKHDEIETSPFSGLHWMTAGLFVAAGVEAAMGVRQGEHRPRGSVRWGPLLAAPAAATAHALRAARPTRRARLASQILDGIAIGVGTVGVASSLHIALNTDDDGYTRRDNARMPSLAPLAFCAVGLLAVMLDDQEEEFEEERARLERRARIVERLLPERKARVDRIVIHA